MRRLVKVTRPDGLEYLAYGVLPSGQQYLLTDENCQACCGGQCPQVSRFIACFPDPCADEPEVLYVCVPVDCPKIKWGERCYQAVGEIIPTDTVPDGGVILTSGMYDCISGCDDPQCEPQCPRYKQAVMCPGQDPPPCAMYMPARNVVACGIFRQADRCWWIDPSFPSVTELPPGACLYVGGVRPNRNCCGFVDVGEPCVPGCSPSFQRQYPCLGPECPPATVTNLECCCSIAGVYTVNAFWRYASITRSNTSRQEQTHTWTLEVDDFGNITSLVGQGSQRDVFIDNLTGQTVIDVTNPLPYPGGIPWRCGQDQCGMIVYQFSGGLGFNLGLCQSQFPFNGSSVYLDPSGRTSTIQEAVKTVSCNRYLARGRYLTTAAPGDPEFIRLEEEFSTTFTAIYRGACSGGCGSSAPPPGARQQLGGKGGIGTSTNTGCASCGGASGSIDTGDAPASL